MIKITEMQKSALQEAGSIGACHAAIALSQLMGKKITIAIPSVEILGIEQISGVVYKKGEVFIQINIAVLGEITGTMMFIINQKTALTLCDIVMGQHTDKTKLIEDLEQSALKEVGNILSASYLNAISELTGISLIISTPKYCIGGRDCLEHGFIDKDVSSAGAREAFCIKTEFIESAVKIEAYLVFVSTAETLNKLLAKMRI